jgi:hypothetical protein
MRSGASKTYAGRASKPAKGRLSTKTHRHEVHEARKRMKIKLNSVIVKDQEKGPSLLYRGTWIREECGYSGRRLPLVDGHCALGS